MSGHSIMGGAYFQIVVSQNSSIQSRCVIWDPFSSDLGSICDTICLQTRVSSTLDPKTQCGWQSTEKKWRISFTHKNSTTSQILYQVVLYTYFALQLLPKQFFYCVYVLYGRRPLCEKISKPVSVCERASDKNKQIISLMSNGLSTFQQLLYFINFMGII